MPTFYERYQSGEHEQVWSDLLALGTDVRHDPIYSDALAVARETMKRAQSNIETLIPRLNAIGYRFDTAQTVAEWSSDRMASLVQTVEALRGSVGGQLAEKLKGLFDLAKTPMAVTSNSPAATPDATNPITDVSIYCPANSESVREIAEVEVHLGGTLPISLRAWYEIIESVSFMGSHPELNPTGQSQKQPTLYLAPSMMNSSREVRQRVESLGFHLTSQAPLLQPDENALPDPLLIAPIGDLLETFEDDEVSDRSFMISPDDLHKAHISGDVYYVDLPDSNADVIFQDWKDGYFVPYLRRVFAWGGFPGWERHANPPRKLIQDLTHGLLPL